MTVTRSTLSLRWETLLQTFAPVFTMWRGVFTTGAFTYRRRSFTLRTTSSALASEVPAIQHQSSGVVIGKVSAVVRTAGPAIRITYQANSPADPVTGRYAVVAVERYEFWRNGVEAVITLAAPVGADNIDPWKTITNSFKWH